MKTRKQWEHEGRIVNKGEISKGVKNGNKLYSFDQTYCIHERSVMLDYRRHKYQNSDEVQEQE